MIKQIIRSFNRTSKRIDTNRLSKILFVKLFAIGDCLNSTPALKALRETLPEVKIDVLVGKWSKPVFSHNPHLDSLIVVDDGIFRNRQYFDLLKLIFRLRAERYDAVLLFHRDAKLGAFLKLCRIPVRIGLDLEGDGYWLTHPIEEAPIEHEIPIYNSLLTPLGIEVASTEMEIHPNATEKQEAENLWQELKKDTHEGTTRQKVIGLTPGGASNPGEVMPQRIWPHYSSLAETLLANGYTVVYFGGKADVDLEKTLPLGDRAVSFIGRGNLRVSAALMQLCDLVVTHDSGPMHLAAASGVPTISIFAPTDPLRKAPLGSQHFSIKADIHCAPCYHRGKWPAECTQECIGQVNPEYVFDKVKESLAKRDTPD